MKRNKRARTTTVEGKVHQGEWDEEWDAEVLTIVTAEQIEYLVKPDRIGNRLAEYCGDIVRIDGLLDHDECRGKVLRIRTFELLANGLAQHDTNDDEEVLEDEERIHSMGFITVRSRTKPSS